MFDCVFAVVVVIVVVAVAVVVAVVAVVAVAVVVVAVAVAVAAVVAVAVVVVVVVVVVAAADCGFECRLVELLVCALCQKSFEVTVSGSRTDIGAIGGSSCMFSFQ